MKKLICGIATLSFLAFGVYAYDDEFDDTATVVEDVNIEDTRDYVRSNSAKYEEISSVEDRTIEQAKLLKKGKMSGKNYNELQILQNNGFLLTKESLYNLTQNFYREDFDHAVTKVNLFEFVNMIAAIKSAFYFAMDPNASSNFISGEHNLPEHIQANINLRNEMQNIIQNSENLSDSDILQSLEKIYSELLIELKTSESTYSKLSKDKNVDKNELNLLSSDIGEINLFSKFVKGMIKIYQVNMARKTADEIMNKYRTDVENRMISTRKSSSVEAGGVANTGAAKVGVSSSVHKDEGSDDSSFYTVSVGGGVRLSVGLGLSKLGAELGVGFDVTKSAVFFSLEQLLDSGKIKTGVLSTKDVKETLKSRQKMQSRERELLSIFGNDVEGYLKMLGVIPVSTYLEWPKLTKAAPADEAINKSKSLDVTVSAFEMLGFNVVANDDIKTWRRPSGYMTLITEECEPSDGLTADDIVNFLGKQYCRLDALEKELQKYDKNNSEKDQISLQSFLSSQTTLEEFISKRVAYQFILTIILGDIRAYNFALNVLAENPSDKNASVRKHQIEERWVPKHKFTSEGRLGMLKSMIATVAVLHNRACTDRDFELFKQLHSEMTRLAQMLEFSKTKSNRSATFMAETTAHNSAIQASASIAIPKFGDVQFSINRSWVRDNPLQDENGDCMSIDIVLPITPVGIVGTGVVHRSLNEYRRLMGQSPASDFGNTFDLTQDGFNLLPNLLDIPEVQDINMAGSLAGKATISISMCRSDASDDASMGNIRPLPGRNDVITKGQNEWMLWYIKGVAFLDSTLEANHSEDIAKLSYSSSIGKEKMIIGSDTFGYLTSRYDAFSLGLKDSKNALSPWKAFKTQHQRELIQLLKNIAYGQSNIIFELQGMYNTIMDNIGNDRSKLAGECYQLFGNFIQACQNLANTKPNEEQKAFEYASSLLDQVLKINFDYNFMVNYNNVYSIKK